MAARAPRCTLDGAVLSGGIREHTFDLDVFQFMTCGVSLFTVHIIQLLDVDRRTHSEDHLGGWSILRKWVPS
jgi:hypothetical protein